MTDEQVPPPARKAAEAVLRAADLDHVVDDETIEAMLAVVADSDGATRTPEPPGLRILVTGSRGWHDRHTVHQAIADAVGSHGDHLMVPDDRLGSRVLWSLVTVVHGDCPRGADRIADRFARMWRMQTERWPADWARHGRAAGPARNAAMIAAGADICLAFPIGASPGTRGCVRLAELAGIPVIINEGVADGGYAHAGGCP